MATAAGKPGSRFVQPGQEERDENADVVNEVNEQPTDPAMNPFAGAFAQPGMAPFGQPGAAIPFGQPGQAMPFGQPGQAMPFGQPGAAAPNGLFVPVPPEQAAAAARILRPGRVYHARVIQQPPAQASNSPDARAHRG